MNEWTLSIVCHQNTEICQFRHFALRNLKHQILETHKTKRYKIQFTCKTFVPKIWHMYNKRNYSNLLIHRSNDVSRLKEDVMKWRNVFLKMKGIYDTLLLLLLSILACTWQNTLTDLKKQMICVEKCIPWIFEHYTIYIKQYSLEISVFSTPTRYSNNQHTIYNAALSTSGLPHHQDKLKHDSPNGALAFNTAARCGGPNAEGAQSHELILIYKFLQSRDCLFVSTNSLINVSALGDSSQSTRVKASCRTGLFISS